MTDQLPVPSPQDFRNLLVAARMAIGNMATKDMLAVAASIHVVASALDAEDARLAAENAKPPEATTDKKE